jgi:hypothetical protein
MNEHSGAKVRQPTCLRVILLNCAEGENSGMYFETALSYLPKTIRSLIDEPLSEGVIKSG